MELVEHEFSSKYHPRTMEVERAVLHTLLPFKLYWRELGRGLGQEKRRFTEEGLLYPSLSAMVFPVRFKVEKIDEKTFKVKEASGYIPCPVCGRNIYARVDEEEVKLENKIEKFTREVAYEIGVTVLTRNLAYRVKRHVETKHDLKTKYIGKTRIVIERYTGSELVLIPAEISTFLCEEHGTRMIGVYDLLRHVVEEHYGDKKLLSRINDLVAKLGALTEKIYRIDKVPLIGVSRVVFQYTVYEKEKKSDKNRLIRITWLKPYLKLMAWDLRDRILVNLHFIVPRPIRMIYHYPPLRFIPHVLAYKSRPEYYNHFFNKTISYIKKNYGDKAVENVETIYELVTSNLIYVRGIEKNTAFEVKLENLEKTVRDIEKIGDRLRVFFSDKEKEWMANALQKILQGAS